MLSSIYPHFERKWTWMERVPHFFPAKWHYVAFARPTLFPPKWHYPRGAREGHYTSRTLFCITIVDVFPTDLPILDFFFEMERVIAKNRWLPSFSISQSVRRTKWISSKGCRDLKIILNVDVILLTIRVNKWSIHGCVVQVIFLQEFNNVQNGLHLAMRITTASTDMQASMSEIHCVQCTVIQTVFELYNAMAFLG